MRHIISMSRRVTCNERRKRSQGEKGRGAVESTRWPRQDGDSANPFYTLPSRPVQNPYEMHTTSCIKPCTYIPPCTLHLFTSCSRNRNNRKRPCWRRKSLRIAKGAMNRRSSFLLEIFMIIFDDIFHWSSQLKSSVAAWGFAVNKHV